MPARSWRIYLGIVLSLAGLYLAIRQVDPAQALAAFTRANYELVGVAAGIQLMVLGVIAARWQRLFPARPEFRRLLGPLLIAHLANSVLPVRLGILIRAYLVGTREGISKALVLGTTLAEKVFDSLTFVLLFVTLVPFVAPGWFHWSALPMSTGVFLTLFPAMVLVTYQRRRFLSLAHALLRWVPGSDRLVMSERLEAGLEGLSRLEGTRSVALLWLWTLLIVGLGALVNWVTMLAFGIRVPPVAAVFLLVALQMGGRIPAPLGGIGVFQYICVKALSFFGVDAHLALSFGFVLQFVAFVPGSLLGAFYLYREHESLHRLRTAVKERER